MIRSRIVSPRLVIAPDKFKGSASARDVASALEAGWRDVFARAWEITSIPMADGGEGTVAAFLDAGAKRHMARVHGPLGALVDAEFAVDGTTAIVESAQASGLGLISAEKRDALRATSYGTGELILAALDAGAQRIVIGIGGSASNDGGAGLLQALGAALLDGDGHALVPGGAALAALKSLSLEGLDARLRSVKIDVASDVDNPLTGPQGASAIFGPQKGASASDVRSLDAALSHYADVVAHAIGRDERATAGAGAAGGLGFALVAVLGGSFHPGVELVGELRGLPGALNDATLCLSGEGSIDAQTLRGKTVDGVARLARAAKVPVIAFGGRVDRAVEPALFERGVTCMPIADGPLSLEEAIRRAPELIRSSSTRVARCWLAASQTTR